MNMPYIPDLQKPHFNPFNLIWIMLAILILVLLMVKVARAEEYSNEAIVNAIYYAEGGAKTRFPYGILSIKVKNEAEARRVCLNTIRNQRIRHAKHKCELDFISCLANRYCPTKGKHLTNDEKRLNKHWLSNVRYWLKKVR